MKQEGDQNWSQASIRLHVGATNSARVYRLITPLSTQLPPIMAFKQHRRGGKGEYVIALIKMSGGKNTQIETERDNIQYGK